MQSKWLPKLSLLLTRINIKRGSRVLRKRMPRLKEKIIMTIELKFLVLFDKF